MKSCDGKTSPDKSDGSQNVNRQAILVDHRELRFSDDDIVFKEELVEKGSLDKGSSITFIIKAEDANVQQITNDILASLSNNCSKFHLNLNFTKSIVPGTCKEVIPD